MTDTIIGDAQPTTRKGGGRAVRCGWCIDGDHANCVVTIRMNNKTLWRCPCDSEGHPTSRCVECNRKGVEVTEGSTCVDHAGCQGDRDRRRAADASFRVIDAIRAAKDQADLAEPAEGPRKPVRTARATGGQCICCGEPTRGGKFLPGHDSRYVKRQAEDFVKAGLEKAPGTQGKITAEMTACGPALLGKFEKRVAAIKEALEAK